MSESWKNICWVIRKWVIENPSMSRGKTSWLSFPWDPSFQHLFLSPNLLQLLCTFNVLSTCFFIVIEEHMLWTIKWLPSTATTLLFQPSCISSRHYVSPDQWCHLVGRVASNAIMWYLDIMKHTWVLGLMLWFQCIVSLLPSSKCLLPNERVILVDIVEGREGR